MDSRCYLIRLSQMRNQIPQSLVNILQDERCLKFGVSCLNDLNRIKNHYLIQPKGGVDLRHLAHNRMLGERIGLQALSKHFLGIDLCKDPILQRSNWQSPCLTLDQIKYASIDAKVALSILFSLLELICRERSIPQAVDYCGPNSSPDFIDLVFEISSPYIGVPFAGQSSRTHHRQSNKSDVFTADSLKKHTPYVTRKRALYENCRLLAPDNELLSLIDTRKVNWYFERDLAELVSEDPYVVKLKFEPKIRPEKGNVDKLYYQAEKQNICVVCGSKDGNGIRKKIVPAEYRKHFPLDHKSYKSHDNLLLCGTCHLVTSLNEDVLKLRIAKEYDSPIDSGASKLNSDPLLFKVKNAARALAQTKYTLPNHKQTEYREIVREFYQVDELGDELIQKASKIDPKNENPNYRAHGEKVVEQVIANGELLQFQMRWRQHFLETMKPKFLPEMWSTTHNPNKDNYF
eukprot:TRINITY_DN7935_c0_g1_i4.p1 TRINITY_DN7935_c0_g1~~TRINITY_DN7935_c0_g1_i4.p1  ORF type:complete len:460 (-),score=82.22 TRINITY_DN7935_c0_g1_i4:42-1421(-)